MSTDKTIDALKKLADVLGELKTSKEEDDVPSIAELAIRMEHQKFKLIQHFKKDKQQRLLFMAIRNMVMAFESNVYSYYLRFFEENKGKFSQEDLDKIFSNHSGFCEALKELTNKIEV